MDKGVTTHDFPGAVAVLAATIRAELRALQKSARKPGKHLRPKRVHELRVALRRLQSALGLCSALKLGLRKRSTRRLRKLLGRLGSARDAHVQLESLSALAARPETEQLLTELRHRRRSASRRASQRLSRFPLADLERDLVVLLRALETIPNGAGTNAAANAVMNGELAARHLELEQRRRSAVGSDPRSMHAVRLALKDYRYLLELLAPVLPARAARVAQVCEELQNHLGAAHDAFVLAKSARRLAAHGPESSSEAGGLSLADQLELSSQNAHRQAAARLEQAELPWPLEG